MIRIGRKKIGLIAVFFGILIISLTSFLWFFRDKPLLSPITSQTIFRFLKEEPLPVTDKKIVYGFLPYWNSSTATIQPELTDLAYFSLTVGPNGTILTQNENGPDPGYNTLKSDDILNAMNTVRKNHGRVELVFAQMDADTIATFITNSTAQQRFFDAMDSALQAYPVDGINIDMEYGGTVTPGLRDHFSEFIEKLHDHLQKKYTAMNLSVDVFAYAANDTTLYDVSRIAQSVDFVVIMAYDFHHRSSIIAGPVAPLFSADSFWDSNITKYLRQYLETVPKSKIVLGIPFYGYEWRTTSTDSEARTYPDTGTTATLDYVQDLLNKKDQYHVEEHWNEDALSPYLSYKKDNQTHIVYYENSRSLSYKLDLVNELELHGVAIWALGYEKDSRELWDVIKNKLGD